MKKMLKMLAALATFGGLAHGTVFIETGFEGSTSLPAGWTQSQISGSATWNVQQGGGTGGTNPSTARSGTNNATLYVGNTNENKTRLTSPVFDTVGYTNLSLTFWHTQVLWSPDQDELKVFFSSDGGTNWAQLAYYTTSVSAWTQRTLVLPSASANSRIMFEGNAKYGYGVCLDDIQVAGIPDTISEVSVSATDASASEVGPDPGTWTITRTGNTTGALSVNFTLSGTATQGSDYTAAPSSPINFAAGETSKVVTLTTLDDMVGAEGNEVATLTLTTGTGYVIGAASGSISIYDDEGFDLNILVIGSTHSFSEGGESDVVHEKPFNPTTIATHLHQIIDQDPAISGSVNVQFEDIYKTKALSLVHSGSAFSNYTSHCYSLAQHFMWPDGKANRLANLRGEAGTQWDQIIICHDPYIMANFPGMVAEGVKLVKDAVAQSANPAQVVLLAQWPESTSTFTANQFNEIVHRVAGSPAGITVVPAGKAWDSYASKDTSANHPTPRGAYLAAASIYSKLYNRSAKTSAYVYPTVGSAIADHALSVVQANNGVAQYSGTYTSFNPFQMKYLTKRVVNYRETGTSTEDRLSQALGRLDDVHRITFGTAGYAGVPGTRWDFNYGRGGDLWEDDKDYEVNPAIHDWVYGFPMHHNNTTAAPNTMPYGIDKHYSNGTSYEDGTDLGTAYNMIRPNTREPDLPESVRAIPIRLMWLKMAEKSPGFNPLGDSTHMHPNLNDASAAFMYTLLSGRCPIVVEPTPQGSANPAWMQWLGHKVGYETAWQISHLTTRSPGFKVLPSSTAATTVTPTTKETMIVQFMNPPQSDVTVNVSISNANAAVVGSKQLVFTPQNYSVPQSVVVAGLPGSAGSEAFQVVFSTVSTDEIYNGLSDTWDYTTTRSAPVTLARVNKGTTQVTANQNLPVTINLNTAGASSVNTVLAGPSNGTTVWSGSNVIYTPASDFVGKDGFSFATNNAGTLSVGYFEITVSDTVPNGMVSYRGNGGDGGAVPIDSSTYAQNAMVTVLGNTGNLTRTGYHFNGWNTAANGSGTTYNAGGTFTMGANGAILYAQWNAVPTYTVSYNGNSSTGGFVPSNQIKTEGISLTLATNSGTLTRSGYTFAGWNTATNGTGTDYAAGGTYSGNTNITLYARWTPNSYTVTFNANGGGTPSPTSKVVTKDSPYGDLATISYPGFIFNGWFTAATGGTKILSTTIVNITGNQTLYAQWTAGTAYTVSYNANGADSGTVPADDSKLEDVTLTLATNSGGLIRANYTFAGWNTAANGSGTAYASGAFYTTNAAVVLYAQWALNTYTVTYNGNGSTDGTAPPNQTKTHGINLPLADAGSLIRTGYTFINWNTEANGSGTAYAAGAAYTNDIAVTLYAQWTALPTYAITYNGNGSTGGTAPLNQAKIQGVNLALLDAGTLIRTGYTFANWNTEANGNGTVYAAGAIYSIDSPLSLYAQWTLLPTYTITYNGNGSTGGTTPIDQTKIQGTDIILSGPGTLERTGYTFTGWNTALNGAGNSYSAEATYTADSAATLYAQWTINTYVVSYDANGSTSGSVSNQTKAYAVNLTLSGVGTLVKTGYAFMGWNTAADGSGDDYASAATYSANAPLALYAQWDRIPTVAVLNPSNGATGASPTGNLTISFSENIAFGSGAFTLRQSNGALVESFHVGSPPGGLNLSGSTVTLNPTSDLAVGITYYVEIDATAIDDLAGNSFAGFSGNSTWSFTILPQILADSYLTGLDVTAPVPLYSSLNFPSFLDGPLTGSSTLTTSGYFGSLLYLVNNGATNTFNGDITLDGGTLRLTSSPFGANGGFTAPSMTSGNTITINRAGTLYIDDNFTSGVSGYTTNRFGTDGNRPAVNLAGGRIDLNGLNQTSSSIQTFGALTASSGQSTLFVTRFNGNPTFEFGSLSISNGAVANFYSAALGTGTNDSRIKFMNTPTLINGILAGAKYWSPGAAGVGEFATYDINGVRAFTASDYTVFNAMDINAATSTQNVQMTGAFAPVALTADRTVNSLNFNGNGGTWSLGGNKLTIGSGMFLRNGTNTLVTIDTGTLTAGNGTDDIDLHFFTAQQNVTINALIADNAASAVTLVKSHGNTLSLSGGENNTYTGGTYVVDGTLSTGNVANRAYLGTSNVTVNGGTSLLTLGNIGATSNSSGDDYTAINGGRIQIASGTNGAYTANDTFHIGAGSVISGNSASGQGLASLTRGTNITLAADAIIGHDYSLTTALNLTTGTIQNLGTNADLYYGFNGSSNQTSASAVINIGTGTAFKGLALFGSAGSFDGGTINVTSGTTDVYIKTNGGNTAAPVNFTLGYDYWAGVTKITLADAGPVDVNVLGNVLFRDPLSTFGDTSTGRIVRFVAAAGSSLQFYSAATGMGSGNGIASALIENGGVLTMNTSADALNGAVTVQAGGRFDAALAGGVTGTGQLTFDAGSLINITHATGFSGSQATAASIAAGTIVRLNQNSFGAADTTLDSVLGSGSNSPIFVIYGNNRAAANPTAPNTSIMTLNKDINGVGGILTNYEIGSRGLSATSNGVVTLGANGGTIASTTGNSLLVAEDITGSGSLTSGTTAIIDGLPKLGTVQLGAANTYTGGTIVNAGTLQTNNALALGSTSGQLTVNTGGTLNMNTVSLTVGNLTGTGGTITGISATRTLTIGQGDFGGGDYQGSIQNGGGTTALTKTGTGTITLSGANAYTGATAINAGTLFINGNQSAATGNVTVAANATLGGTGTLGGNTSIAAGGKLEFDINTAAGSHNPLDMASGKTLSFSGASTLTITSSSGAEPGIYTLVTGIVTGTLPTLSLPSGWVASVSIVGNSLQLNVTSTGGPGPVASFQITGVPSQSIVGTTITGITFTARDAANAIATSFTGTVTFGGTAEITGTSASFTAGILSGVSITPMVAGSSLTFTVDDGALHTGSATFTVQSFFEDWAGSSGLTGGEAGPGVDPDGDGLTNLQEFAFGTNPAAGRPGPIQIEPDGKVVEPGLPDIVNFAALTEPADFRAVFPRRKDHAMAGLAYKVEFSADLTRWTENNTGLEVLSTESAGAVDAVSVPFPPSVPVTTGDPQAPKFFRVSVMQN